MPGEASTTTTTSSSTKATANSATPGLADAGPVEPADALGVDERLPHPQPRQERRGHPGPVLVEELDQVEVGADHDDQLGALLVREQHRDVLARPGGRDRRGGRARRSSSRSWPGRAAVGIGVDDQLGAAAQRRVGRAVHVAEDHVRLEARLEHGVGAAVDGDDQRAHVADVGAERGEVLAVGRARGRRSAPGGRRSRSGSAAASISPESRLALLAHVLDRVRREVGDRRGRSAIAARRAGRSRSAIEGRVAVGDRPSGEQHVAAVELDDVAAVEHARTGRRRRPRPGRSRRGRGSAGPMFG